MENTQLKVLTAAFASAHNGVIIIDYLQAGEPIIYCNTAFEELTGYSAADVLGKNCRFLQGEELQQPGGLTIHEALQKQESCTVELHNYRKDGTAFWNEIHISPIRDEAGNTTHYIGIQNNISERKIRAMQEHKSEELTKEKDQFITAASHELKTPLTTLKASLQLMEKHKNNADFELMPHLIAQSGRSLKKISMLVDGLLNIDRISNGQLALSKTTFKINDLLESCCTNIKLEDKYKLTITGEAPEVHADEFRIDQVIDNLVNNAVKFAPESHEINLSISDEPGFARVSITDKGNGIAAGHLKRLFDRYYQADPKKSESTGLGLGLFISAQIIRLHGGEIGVESEIGKGSTFWFTLPVKQMLYN